MNLSRLFQRYSLLRRPTLKVVNPRIGTSIIPLGNEDSHIFFQYLSNKLHALHFEGSEGQLRKMIMKLQVDQGITVEKMRTSLGRGREKIMLLHLKLPNKIEIRRVIKMN